MSARAHNQQAVDLARSLDDCFHYPPIQSMEPTIATPDSPWGQAKQQVMSLPKGPVSPYNAWFDLVEGVTYPTINTCLDYVRGIKALICSDSLYSVFPIARSAAEGIRLRRMGLAIAVGARAADTPCSAAPSSHPCPGRSATPGDAADLWDRS